MKFTIQPLTPELWPALEDLFGEQWPVSRCWCMYWRIGNDYRKRPPEANKAALCELTPRQALPWLDRTWRLKRVDEVPVWSLSCFYVRKGYRKRGVTSALIAAALEAAKRAGAPALEAYPLDANLTPSTSSTGYVSTFQRAGFKIVARRVPARPIVRYEFKKSDDRSPAPRSKTNKSK